MSDLSTIEIQKEPKKVAEKEVFNVLDKSTGRIIARGSLFILTPKLVRLTLKTLRGDILVKNKFILSRLLERTVQRYLDD
jgi:hypothetical protein